MYTGFFWQAYVPSVLDVLYSRKATKGIVEHTFDIRGVPFKFVDVGGQRSQRQKWYQCFECVTSILFLVSSSEFDQVLFEDRKTNRLLESCNIFETIVNNKAFVNVSIILFLNKMDLLTEKIKEVSLTDYFPSFKGNPHSMTDVQYFLLQMFDSRRRERSKPLFHHFTTAVDTNNIQFVFQAVRDTILQANLRSLMLQWAISSCSLLVSISFLWTALVSYYVVSQHSKILFVCENLHKPFPYVGGHCFELLFWILFKCTCMFCFFLI